MEVFVFTDKYWGNLECYPHSQRGRSFSGTNAIMFSTGKHGSLVTFLCFLSAARDQPFYHWIIHQSLIINLVSLSHSIEPIFTEFPKGFDAVVPNPCLAYFAPQGYFFNECFVVLKSLG